MEVVKPRSETIFGFLQKGWLVDQGIREWGCGKTDTGIGGIVHGIEALEESEAQNEVETWATVPANVIDNEVDEASSTTNLVIEVTRPDLGVRCESVGIL